VGGEERFYVLEEGGCGVRGKGGERSTVSETNRKEDWCVLRRGKKER